MSDRITELRRKRAAIVAEMRAILEKETDESPLDDESKNRFDELKDSITDHDQRIGRLEDMVQAEGDEVDDEKSFLSATGRSTMGINIKQDRSLEPKGTKAARFLIGAGLARKQGMDAGVNYIKNDLGDLEVSKALNSTGTSAAGGLLVPQAYRAELIDLLWASTVVRSSNPTLVPLPLGNITMPRLSSASQATWIGESTPIPSNQPVFDQIVMSAKKLAGIVPVQNDLLRRSPLAVESIVRTQMVRQLGLAEDAAFLNSAGSGFTPKGIVAWALPANVLTSTVAPTLSVVNNVLANAHLTLMANNIPTDRAVWIMNPQIRTFLSTLTDGVGRYFFQEELSRGTLFGFPFKMTTNLTTSALTYGTPVVTTLGAAATAATTLTVASSAGMVAGQQISGTGITLVTTIVSVTDATHIVVSPAVTAANSATVTANYPTSPLILVAMDQVLLGDTMSMYADSSDVASYYNGTDTISAYQSDQTVFRIIEEVDLAVSHPAAINVNNVFNWLPTGGAVQGATPYSTQTATYPASPSLSATPV